VILKQSSFLRSMADGLRNPPANLKAFLDAGEDEFDQIVRETIEGSGEWRDLAPKANRFREAAE